MKTKILLLAMAAGVIFPLPATADPANNTNSAQAHAQTESKLTRQPYTPLPSLHLPVPLANSNLLERAASLGLQPSATPLEQPPEAPTFNSERSEMQLMPVQIIPWTWKSTAPGQNHLIQPYGGLSSQSWTGTMGWYPGESAFSTESVEPKMGGLALFRAEY